MQVKRSSRRRRTVTAYRDGDTVWVLIPDRFTPAEEQAWVEKMVVRLAARNGRRRRSDQQLLARARHLSDQYFDGAVEPESVRWVSNQQGRWGSCTPIDRTIRLSDRLQTMPSWVVDYVLVHELAHLKESSHNEAFWHLVDRYPRAQRARGYLEGVAAAAGIDLTESAG